MKKNNVNEINILYIVVYYKKIYLMKVRENWLLYSLDFYL